MRRILHILTLATAYMLIWAPAAWAGPAVGAFVVSIIKKVVISMVISAVSQKLFGPKKSDQRAAAAAASAILVNKQSNNDAIPVIYGRRRMGGVRAYIESSDGAGDISKSQYLNMVIVMCEGEMGAIQRVWFNDEITWDVTQGGTTTALGNGGYDLDNYVGKFASSVEMHYYPGTPDQTVDAMMETSVGSAKWSTNHRLRGIGYIVVKLTANAEKYQGAAPLITVEIAGKRIKNVATGVYYASADQNPVDVLYDYLTNTIYGKGLTDADLDLASFTSARSYADSKGYAINGILDTNQQLYQNIETITSAFNANLIYTAGKYRLKIRQDNETGSFDFNETNIIGNIEINVTDVTQRLNKITVNYSNSAAEIAYNDDMVVIDDAGYLALDNNKIQEATVQQQMITSESLITQLAQYTMDASRYQMAVAFEAAHTAFVVEAGDIVTLTIPELGFNGRPFRVMTLELTVNNTIGIVAQEYQASIEI